MDSKDVEAAVHRVEQAVGELHDALVNEGETAWVDLPCIGIQASPSWREIRVSLRLGLNDSE